MQKSAITVGLSAEQLASLFPFYFIVNREFRFVQLGTSISAAFDADIAPNGYMDNFFEITTPSSLLNWGYLRSLQNQIASVRHKKTQIDFSARILALDSEHLLFLLKPLLNSNSYMDQLGLKPSDFSNHDLIHNLFLHNQHARTRAEITLSEALISQEEQLREIRQLLANQEAESRKLAHIISRSTYWILISNSMGEIEWVNEAYINDSGYIVDDINHSNMSNLLGIQAEEFEAVKAELAEGRNFRKEILLTDAGHDRWIDIDIRALLDDQKKIVNLIAIGRDITEEKNARLLSERLSQELNAIFEFSPDGLVSFDEKGRLGQVNAAFLKFTGINDEVLSSLNSSTFETYLEGINEYHSHDRDKGGKAGLIKISKPKLTILRHSVKRYPADNEQEKAIHYFQDITHEFELSRMKGEFLSAAAHELRTPMASIFGFTDLMINRSYTEQQTKEILQNVYRQATRMTNLINDLLDLSRIEAKGKLEFIPKVISVNQLVNSVLDEFKVNFKTRQVDFFSAETEAVLKGDFDKLTQVLINLLSNANKYSQEDKKIEISIDSRQKNNLAYVGIKVKDYGVGMSKRDLDRLFEPFFRSTNTMKVPGTGLGMCIVKEIIDIHGGEIEVDSEPEVGTQVTVWVPMAN